MKIPTRVPTDVEAKSFGFTDDEPECGWRPRPGFETDSLGACCNSPCNRANHYSAGEKMYRALLVGARSWRSFE